MSTQTLSHARQDLEYLRHGDRKMILRLYRPEGTGPFPVVVDLHGGAWNNGSIDDCDPRDQALAEAGIAAAAVDFRHAADGYPTSLIDINYAVRWLKANAPDLGLDAGCVAITGQSSGGHLAMLAAMRPDDARYTSIALPGSSSVDASVVCVGMLWPVINPLSRYRHALRSRAETPPAAWVKGIPELHDTYWRTEEAMAEGNPVLILENGDRAQTPPAVWIQGRPDIVHDYRDPDSPHDLNEPERFAAGYRNAGGEIEIVDINQASRDTESVEPLMRFLKQQFA